MNWFLKYFNNKSEIIASFRMVYPINADPKKFDPPLNEIQKKLLKDIYNISRTIPDRDRFLNYVDFVSDIKQLRSAITDRGTAHLH